MPVMGPVMISARHRLSWTPSSSKFFLLSEVSFHRCAETPRRRAKSTRRRAPSSSPPSSCLSKVRSPSPYTQPSRGLFALKIPNCSFFSALRAAVGAVQLSCNGARGGAAWVREAYLAAWCRNFHSLWRCWVNLDGGCCRGSKMAVLGGSGWRAGAVRRACCA